MRDDRFEWDDRKAKSNLRKHDVAFEHVREAFDDPRPVLRIDDDETDEERWLLTGMGRHRLVTVCYIERGKRVRIISAWKATNPEADGYNHAT